MRSCYAHLTTTQDVTHANSEDLARDTDLCVKGQAPKRPATMWMLNQTVTKFNAWIQFLLRYCVWLQRVPCYVMTAEVVNLVEWQYNIIHSTIRVKVWVIFHKGLTCTNFISIRISRSGWIPNPEMDQHLSFGSAWKGCMVTWYHQRTYAFSCNLNTLVFFSNATRTHLLYRQFRQLNNRLNESLEGHGPRFYNTTRQSLV